MHAPAYEPGPGQVQVVHATSLGGVDIAQAGAKLPDDVRTAGYMGVTGRVGADVRNIVIHARDVGNVAASMPNGWFAAWWPSLEQLLTSMTVTTTTGSYTVHL